MPGPRCPSSFPGTVKTFVTYTLVGSSLNVSINATTDKPTPLNVIQHVYFNLKGAASNTTVTDTVVQVRKRLRCGAALAPVGVHDALLLLPLVLPHDSVRLLFSACSSSHTPAAATPPPALQRLLRQINSKSYAPAPQGELVPTGQVFDVRGDSVYDFTSPKPIGKDLQKANGGPHK